MVARRPLHVCYGPTKLMLFDFTTQKWEELVPFMDHDEARPQNHFLSHVVTPRKVPLLFRPVGE